MNAVNHDRTATPPHFVTSTDKTAPNRTLGINVPWRRLGIYLVLALLFFLLGAVPMFLRARGNAAELNVLQRELTLSQMENKLSAATIDARRGEYEPARQRSSDFFTALRNQIDIGSKSVLTATQRENLTSVLSQRDDIITFLARNDPAAADRLLNLYVTYRKTMTGVQAQNGTALAR